MHNAVLKQTDDYSFRKRFEIKLQDDEGETLTSGALTLIKSSYGDGFIDALCFGAVATPMKHRRKGYVRELFDVSFKWGIENGAIISVLHPFSFSYYEKFGYGKVSDHRIVRLPIRLLDTVPRCSDLERLNYSSDDLEEIYALHNEFCKGRQLMMLYSDPNYFAGKDLWAFRENGKITGYVTVTSSKRLEINHYEDGLLTVHNIVYKTPTALRSLLGFIRMFEGELDDVEFANLSVCPEVETYLRHDTHTKYRLLPDLMVRVLDTEKLLKSFKYPKEEGSFILRVEDNLPTVGGVFSVKYGSYSCEIQRLDESREADITLSAPVFSRFAFGYDRLTAEQARFCDGISINGNAEDFFRAFSHRPAGMFEHF